MAEHLVFLKSSYRKNVYFQLNFFDDVASPVVFVVAVAVRLHNLKIG